MYGEFRRYREGRGMYEHFFFLGDILYDSGGILDCGYKRGGEWSWYFKKAENIENTQETHPEQETRET